MHLIKLKMQTFCSKFDFLSTRSIYANAAAAAAAATVPPPATALHRDDLHPHPRQNLQLGEVNYVLRIRWIINITFLPCPSPPPPLRPLLPLSTP